MLRYSSTLLWHLAGINLALIGITSNMDDEMHPRRFDKHACLIATLLLCCSCSDGGQPSTQTGAEDGRLAAPDLGQRSDAVADGATPGIDHGRDIGHDVAPPKPDVTPPECSSDKHCDDKIQCTTNRCVSGKCTFPAKPKGAACSSGVCDGTSKSGSCVQCVSNQQCGGKTPRCHLKSRTCVSQPLRVMSFNIRVPKTTDGVNSWSNRKKLAIKVITDHDPDIVGMQEVQPSQRQDFLSALPKMAAYAATVDQWGNQNVILYRKDRLSLTFKGVYWLSKTPFVAFSVGWDAKYSRNCNWAIFTRKSDGRGFYFYNTHFDHQGSTARLESAKYLVYRIKGRLEQKPAILVGDLNAGEQSAPLVTLKKLLVDTFRVLYPKASNVGTGHGFTGKTTGAKIDYVLVEPSTVVEQAQIIHDNAAGLYPSDHFPVSAQISFR